MFTTSAAIAFKMILLVTAFLCNIIFGEMLVFQTVVMPGIAKLDDGEFLRAFQAIDGVIQANEPVFVSTWIGSVLFIVVAAICGVVWSPLVGNADGVLEESWQAIGLLVAALAWLVCQWSTLRFNIPRNNRVKALNIAGMKSGEKVVERTYFEATWNKWHLFRTVLFGMVALYLLVLLLIIN
uniref:DUF1772 domain-containing protein n=1 Tax=Pseudictyota dubia TaxID=2749911 RepID=A0A7R9VN97_9STRA|mmetsp:Transcript_19299/g.36042  ORF Transcript_19299/g.36042 Transcript_19299/m.36042 type:complete len:182 (+) Transcript_19299:76-621(+)